MKYQVHASKKLIVDYDLDPDEFDIDFDKAEEKINENTPDINSELLLQEINSDITSQLKTIEFDGFNYCEISDDTFDVGFFIEAEPDYDKEELQWLADELVNLLWENMDYTSVNTYASGTATSPGFNPFSDYGYYETEEDFETDECEVTYNFDYLGEDVKITEIEEVK